MNTRHANMPRLAKVRERHARQHKIDALRFDIKLIAVALVACAIGLAISYLA